jgi:uncharacterized protein
MSDASIDPGAIEEIARFLGARADQVIETHAARVFLVGPHAYKLKKPVDLGYLDFSTPAKRQAVIRRELALNKPGAPDVYMGVQMVTRERDGMLALGGQGSPLEAVLKMRRFDSSAVLSQRPETVKGGFAEHLGRTIARYHAAAEPTPDGGGAAALDFVIQSNAAHLRSLDALRGEDAEALIEATQGAFEMRAPLLDDRKAAGRPRRCHGDLHLGNIVVLDGQPTLFDCIEFNDVLSHIDPLYDLAFLIMDLCFRGQSEGAVRVLNGYLDQAARTSDDALAGMAALPLFLSVRAAVRAHVSAQMGDADKARAYLAAARAHLAPEAPSLAAIGGLSGAGKSTVARRLALKVGAAPGAVVLRSDEIRKRLWSVGPTDRLPPEAYAPGQSERVYGAMMLEAGALLAAGRAVVLDAVFLKEAEREACAALASQQEVGFAGAWLEASADVLRERVAARHGDASDADVAVLEQQLGLDAGKIAWLRLDAAVDPEVNAASIAAL